MLSNTGINKIILLGQITSDPFTNSTVKNQDYLNITLLTNELIKRGERSVEHNEYHKIKVPVKLLIPDYLQLEPGQLLYIEGKIQTRSYIDEQRIKRYDLEILASKVELISFVNVIV